MAPLNAPTGGSAFTLNSAAGVASFFGGEEAIAVMATVHLFKGRKWLGWYNSPGTYAVAHRFGRMANSRFWNGLFPGPNESPAVSLGLDGSQGPEYIAPLSGTTMRTGHLAYLTMKKCGDKHGTPRKIHGNETQPISVGYLAMTHVDYSSPVKPLPFQRALLALIPITVSVVAYIMCALVYDWSSFFIILLSIFSSGMASLVIGRGRLVIKSVEYPTQGSPPGHGILMGQSEMVVIKGKERDVNIITKGRFDLETNTRLRDEENGANHSYNSIGFCALLLFVQSFCQLLYFPHGTFFGQIMFLVSLAVSWGYNSYLSSLEKEKIQMQIFFQSIGNPPMIRFRVGTRTATAVFVCLLLFHKVKPLSEAEERDHREKVLRSCLPNDTLVWRRWKEKVVRQLMNIDYGSESLPYLQIDEKDEGLSESDRELLNWLLEDAVSAFRGYFEVCGGLPVDSTHDP